MPSTDRAARVPAPERTDRTPTAVLDGGALPAAPTPVLDLIDARAQANPTQPALVQGTETLSYSALCAAVADRAAQLAAVGAGPGRLVAIRRPRGIEAIVTILATLQTGAAYLPLDPDAPAARNAAILADAQAPSADVATDPALVESALARLAEHGVAVLDGPGAGLDVAYVIYTSGSTGTPNGVVVGHEALAHFVAGATAVYGISKDDRVLQFAPLHFDASVEEVFVTLCAGGTLVLRTEDMLDVPGLLAGCVEQGITVLDLPTAYWHELAYAIADGVAQLPDSLRTVIIGGEAALPERVARWCRTVGARVRLLNTYGPTEATVVATVADLSAWDGDGVPIGLPLPGVRAALVDGELWLLGGGLARGYLGRPELTERRFTSLGDSPAYRTGDLARIRDDGQIGYFGRVDDEVKISGHRIDPAAVEAVLAQNPAIREAAVVAQPAPDGSKRLVAFVVPSGRDPSEDSGRAGGVAQIREHLAAHLPPPAVPGTICLVGALPRTSTGKIDRNLLKSMPTANAQPSAMPSFNTVELDEDQTPEEDRVPLSFAQRRLWFLGRMEGPSATYNVPLVIQLDGVPNHAALKAAVADVIERHEVLRTILPSVGGEPYQRVLESESVGDRLGVVECTPDTVDDLVAAFGDEVFDLATDVPVRAQLFVPGADASVLVILIHHVATDGWSMGPLLRDLAEAYESRLLGAAPAWEPLPVQYADYTLWQREALGESEDEESQLAQQVEYWRGALAGLPQAVDLPTDRPRTTSPNHQGASVSAVLDPAEHQRLLEVCETVGASLFMVFQAGLALALRRVGAGEDLAIGTPVAGRSDEALHDLIGFFVNTLVLRTDVSGDPTLAELVERVRDADLAAYAHQDLPFDLLVEHLNPPRSLASHPFFQVMLTLEGGGQAEAPIPLGPLAGRIEAAGLDTAKFDLSVSCLELYEADNSPRGVEVWLQYATDLFDEETALLLTDVYVRVMRALAADAGTLVSQAAELTEQEADGLAARRVRVAEAAVPGSAVTVGARGASSPRAEILAGLFAEVLGLPSVAAGDNFFDLGGHSLLGVRLVNRVRAVLGAEIGIKDLFIAPTAAGLDRRITETDAGSGAARPALVPAERPERIPLSYAQRRLWFLDELDGPSSSYNIPIALKLDRELDSAVLADALADVAARHEVLRTVYRTADGEPYQFILEDSRPELTTLSCGEADLPEAIAAATGYVFDLGTEIPFRAWLISAAEQYLVVLVHHIAADGWSMSALAADLADAYAARAGGSAPAWAPLPVQYADYALWQHDLLSAPAGEPSPVAADLDFWRTTLAGAPQVLDLPTHRSRPAIASHGGGVVPFGLDAPTHQRLARLAADTGSTLFMVLQAALGVTLSRLGSGPDVMLGTMVAGRGDTALDDLVGFFVNTLVLRTDTSGNPAFADLVTRVRQADLAAYAHQDLPFDLLVEHLNPQRSTAHHPLVQVTLMLEHDEAGDGGAGESALAGSPVPVGAGAAKFDLTLTVRDVRDGNGAAGGLQGFLGYATDLFDAPTAELLSSRIARVLQAAATDPTVRVDEIDLLAADEREWLLHGYNEPARPTEAAIPAGCTHEFFEQQARRTPDRIAVAHRGRELGYREVNQRANALAHRLIADGVKSGDRVALLMELSEHLIVAILAVLKCGAAYVPVGTALPGTRVRMILEDSGASTLLTDQANIDSEIARGERAEGTRIVAADEPLTADSNTTDPALPIDDRSLMYVMFTSGSTGRPKGVGVTHRNVRALAADRYWNTDNLRRMLVHSAYGFDASTLEIWVPLLHGCTLVVASGNGTDIPELTREIEEYDVTAAYFTTGLFHLVADEGIAAIKPLREVWTGGDVTSPASVQRILDHCPNTVVVHSYGPTEITFCSHQQRIETDERRLPEIGLHLGIPMSPTRVYVLDERLQPVPIGGVGELYLAGPQVTPGYLGRAGLTAERFVADPFGADGGRMYRTGDQAGWTAQRELRFIGRADGQVKLRGFRIEPAEIESALGAIPGVRQAMVLVREDRPGDKRLVAYVVLDSGSIADEAGLRGALGSVLPDYMVPSAIVILDAIPLTTNGKPDRAALPAPAAAVVGGRGPRTAREQILCNLFAEVLGVERVGLDDGFFDLGGHSLLATRLINRVRTTLGAQLGVRDLFQAPTVAGLDARIADAQDGPARPALLPAVRPERVPLSYAQRRLWFVNELEGPSSSYTIPVALSLEQAVDPGVLADALADVAARHEALRTVFAATDGEPYQIVLDEARPVLTLVDTTASGLTAAIEDAAGHVFDLAAEIPLRAWLFEVADGGGAEGGAGQVLLILVHHIAGDGWSMPVLLGDLATAYAARAAGTAPRWTVLPVQYADFALWQRDVLGEPSDPDSAMAKSLDFWQDALAGAPSVLDLPADRARPAVASGQGDAVEILLGADTHRLLGRLAGEQGATIFMVLQAAFAVLLSRLGAGGDVPIGTVVAGREDEALDGLVGFFINTLVLRTDTTGNPAFSELLRRVREADLAAYAHQDLPFDRLVERLRPERSAAHHPLVQVMLALQNAVAADGGSVESGTGEPSSALAGAELPVASGGTKFDLTLTLREQRDSDGGPLGLAGHLEYAADLFDPATAEALAARLVRILDAVAENPALGVNDIDLLGAGERDWLLTGYNNTAAPEQTGTAHGRFEAWARREPDRIAVSYEDVDLSFAEANRRANVLAHRLIAAGVQPEDNVGILMERTDNLIVATLAVLKCGAAYLPIGDHAPASRVRTMMTDADATVLVTDTATAAGEVVLAELGAGTTVLAADGPAAPETPDSNPGVPTADDALMYVMFTSGSTGRPKGVGVTHRNVVQFASDRAWDPEIHRCVLVHSPYSFDASTYEIWVPLLNGGRVAVVPGEGSDPVVVARTVERHGVTAAFFTVGLFHILAEEGLELLGQLREVGTGGDVVSLAAIRRILEHCPDTAVVHAYGPTEGTYASNMHRFVSFQGLPGSVPLGRPMDNTQVYVLDDRLNPVPLGSAGELYIGGEKVARGYLGHAALTADRFVANPFDSVGGGRMYRTGDRASWTQEGELRFAGRADSQVKLRGFRIEPGEIEAAITRRSAVGRAAVVLREDRPGDKRLVAYVVPAAGRADEVDEGMVRAAVAEDLPDYMVPAAVVVLDALPLTTNGKLDRAALPAPALAGGPVGRAPRTARERELCALFAEVLGVPGVGLDDGFFDLGGHSLMATRLVSRIRRELGPECTVRDLFRAPTVAGLLAALDGGQTDADSGSGSGSDAMGVLLPLNAQGTEPPLFCVHPGAGLSWPYAGLVRHLGAAQPVYGLQTRALSQPGYRAKSVEEMADDYLEQILSVRPQGPYRLLGWSFGGLVAHALATRLQAAGEEVQLLALVDSYPVPESESEIPISDRELVELLIGSPADAPQDLPEGFFDHFDPEAVAQLLRRTDPVLAGLAPEEVAALVDATVNHVHIMRDFRPADFDGDVEFFTATRGRDPRTPKRDLWNAFASGRIHNHDIDAEHLRMADPEPLARIGEVLSAKLTGLSGGVSEPSAAQPDHDNLIDTRS